MNDPALVSRAFLLGKKKPGEEEPGQIGKT